MCARTSNALPQFLEDEERGGRSIEAPRALIQDLLRPGQIIMVQVAKDPLGTKGARVTTHLSLAGRHVVFMPTLKHVGISRRIADPSERERLRHDHRRSLKPKGGVIIRTACEGATAANLEADLDYLYRLVVGSRTRLRKAQISGTRARRNGCGTPGASRYAERESRKGLGRRSENPQKVLAFVSQFMPKYRNAIQLHEGAQPLFDLYDVDLEISRSLDRKIWLKSGGYIVIDEAEALVVVDVNTGKFVGKKDLEDTILKTNLEAVKEIAYQLRIRNCGGIIIIDLIDMEKAGPPRKSAQSTAPRTVARFGAQPPS